MHTMNATTNVVNSGEVVYRYVHTHPNVIAVRVWVRLPDGRPMVMTGERRNIDRRIMLNESLPPTRSGEICLLESVELICEEPLQ